MQLVTSTLPLKELKNMAGKPFADMVKAVVDIERQVLAVDAELHSDLEAFLLQNGSKQKNLWGINFYPGIEGDDFLEFDSMINLRPSQGNRSRGVDSIETQSAIRRVVALRITQ